MVANEFWHLVAGKKHEERITSRSSVLRQSAQRKAAFGNVIRNTWVWQPGTHEAYFCLLRHRQLRRNNSYFPIFYDMPVTCPHQMCLCNICNGQIYILRFCQILKKYIMVIKCFILVLSVSLKVSIPLWFARQLLKLKHAKLIRKKEAKQ